MAIALNARGTDRFENLSRHLQYREPTKIYRKCGCNITEAQNWQRVFWTFRNNNHSSAKAKWSKQYNRIGLHARKIDILMFARYWSLWELSLATSSTEKRKYIERVIATSKNPKTGSVFGVLNFSKIAISRLSSAKTKIKELELPYTRVGPQQLDQVLVVCRMTFLRSWSGSKAWSLCSPMSMFRVLKNPKFVRIEFKIVKNILAYLLTSTMPLISVDFIFPSLSLTFLKTSTLTNSFVYIWKLTFGKVLSTDGPKTGQLSLSRLRAGRDHSLHSECLSAWANRPAYLWTRAARAHLVALEPIFSGKIQNKNKFTNKKWKLWIFRENEQFATMNNWSECEFPLHFFANCSFFPEYS